MVSINNIVTYDLLVSRDLELQHIYLSPPPPHWWYYWYTSAFLVPFLFHHSLWWCVAFLRVFCSTQKSRKRHHTRRPSIMTEAKAVSGIICTVAGLSSSACCAVVASYACMNDRPKLSDPSSMIIFLTVSDLALSIVSIISMKGSLRYSISLSILSSYIFP